jgi:Na+/melibiose symporter-like transporter
MKNIIHIINRRILLAGGIIILAIGLFIIVHSFNLSLSASAEFLVGLVITIIGIFFMIISFLIRKNQNLPKNRESN